MQSIQKENKGELIAVDFLGPLPRSSRGVKHILVCIDVFSKAVRLYPIMRPTTKVVLKILKANPVGKRSGNTAKKFFRLVKTASRTTHFHRM